MKPLSCARIRQRLLSRAARFAAACFASALLASTAPLADGTWQSRAPMPHGPLSGAGVGVIDGIVYVVGGFTTFTTCSATNAVRAYDPSTDTWTLKAPLPASPRIMVATAVVDGILYAIGGGPNCGEGMLSEVFAYDPATDVWTPRAPVPGGGIHAARATVVDGKILVAGGVVGPPNTAVTTVRVYDPATDSWSLRAPMTAPRHSMPLLPLGGLVYAIGGHQGSSPTASIEAYDPVADAWTSRTPFVEPVCCNDAVSLGGRLWMPGGASTAGVPYTAFRSYDPGADTWRDEPPMAVARANHAVAEVNGTIYVMGGQTANSLQPTTSVAAFVPLLNRPPLADAGADQTLAANASCQAVAQLDGSASSDPDGDALTFAWSGDFGTASTVNPAVTLALGTHAIALTVDDGKGGTASDAVQVTVTDTAAPTATATASPSVLWPPDHRLVDVTVAANGADNCGAASCRIVAVASSEPPDATGDGATQPDFVVTGDLTVQLRAEREGSGKGRTYTITVQCTDVAGNTALTTVTAVAPKSQS